MSDSVEVNDTEKCLAEWRDEAIRTREAALVLMEALEWMISNEPRDSPKRGVLVSRAAIAHAKAMLFELSQNDGDHSSLSIIDSAK